MWYLARVRFALDGTFLHDAATWAPAWRAAYTALASSGDEKLAVYTNHLRPKPRPDLPEKIEIRPIRLPRSVLLGAWRRGLLPIETWTGRVDAVWVVSYRLPPARARRVLFLHDLAFLSHPTTFPEKMRRDLAKEVPRVVRSADLVVAASHATRREACDRIGVDPDRIRVVFQGVDHSRFDPVSRARDAEVLARHGLAPGFLLAVGTIEPRKNLARLANAYVRAGGGRGLGRDLVLAGGRGWIDDEEYRGLAACDGGVRLLGFVPREDLPALYRSARAFVYPSLCEGFGLGVLEALASGTPVLTAATSSLPEVGGPGAYYVDPLSEDEIAEGIRRLVSEDDASRTARVRMGIDFAAGFTWDRTARGMRAALRGE